MNHMSQNCVAVMPSPGSHCGLQMDKWFDPFGPGTVRRRTRAIGADLARYLVGAK
jgi:hypothetical protein